MDLRPAFTSLKNPNDILELKKILTEISDTLDTLYTTTDPSSNISARQGRLCLYNNSGVYKWYINVDGATTWQEISNQTLWQVDGTETQLKTADEIDMQSKKIINVTDPASAQDASTKNYTDGKISKTTAGEIAAMTEKTTPADADLILIEDSAAGNAKKKMQKSNFVGNFFKLKSVTPISSGVSSDITIAPSKLYKVIVAITDTAADDTVALRFNSTASGYLNSMDGATTYLTIGQVDFASANNRGISCSFDLDTNVINNNRARVHGTTHYYTTASVLTTSVFGGNWIAASVTLADFEVLAVAGTVLTGNIYLYEYDLAL